MARPVRVLSRWGWDGQPGKCAEGKEKSATFTYLIAEFYLPPVVEVPGIEPGSVQT